MFLQVMRSQSGRCPAGAGSEPLSLGGAGEDPEDLLQSSRFNHTLDCFRLHNEVVQNICF